VAASTVCHTVYCVCLFLFLSSACACRRVFPFSLFFSCSRASDSCCGVQPRSLALSAPPRRFIAYHVSCCGGQPRLLTLSSPLYLFISYHVSGVLARCLTQSRKDPLSVARARALSYTHTYTRARACAHTHIQHCLTEPQAYTTCTRTESHTCRLRQTPRQTSKTSGVPFPARAMNRCTRFNYILTCS